MGFDDLTFELIDDFNLIPKYLFEQIEGRSWSVERLCKFAPTLLVNDASRVWKLVNGEQETKGVLWAVIDILSEKLNVIIFSVDEEYQSNGSLKNTRDFLRQFIKDFNKIDGELKLKEKINWITARPGRIFNEIGGSRLKTIIVEA